MRNSRSCATTRRSTSAWTKPAPISLTTIATNASIEAVGADVMRRSTPVDHTMKSQLDRKKLFSFEFFPPKTPEGVEKLRATRKQLAQLNPAFFSVTYGAGGSTREGTLSAVLEIRKDGHEA